LLKGLFVLNSKRHKTRQTNYPYRLPPLILTDISTVQSLSYPSEPAVLPPSTVNTLNLYQYLS